MSCIYKYKGKKYSEEQFKEYFINNKQEFATSIAKNKDVMDSFKRKIEGIDYVFSQSPELASIGNKAQYLQYLSTIFPNSKVKDIVYHGTRNKELIIEEGFKNNSELFKPDDDRAYESGELGYGYYFTTTQQSAKNYGEPLAVILNNPDITNETTFNLTTNEKGIQHFVKTKQQIHILGGKNDIEGFKEFVDEPLQFNPSDKIEQVNKIRDDKWFNEVISPIINRFSILFPQIKSEVISISDISKIPVEIRGKVKFIQDSGKRINSFYHNGKVFIIKEYVTKEITAEEFLHPFVNALEVDNKELFNSLLKEAKILLPELKEEVFRTYEGVYNSIFDLNREFLTQALAQMYTERIGERTFDNPSFAEKILNWLKGFSEWFANILNRLFGTNISSLSPGMTMSEIVARLDSQTPILFNVKENTSWSFSEDDMRSAYKASGSNKTQRDVLDKLFAINKRIERVERGDSHVYIYTYENGDTVELKSVTKALNENKSQFPDFLKERGEFGTLIHKIVERINSNFNLNSSIIDDMVKEGLHTPLAKYLETPGQEEQIFREVASYMMDYIQMLRNKGSVVLSEVTIGDPESKIGGTIDILEITEDGLAIIHDIKSMSIPHEINFSDELFHVNVTKRVLEIVGNYGYDKQLSGYARLVEKAGIPVKKQGGLKVVPVTYKFKKNAGKDENGRLKLFIQHDKKQNRNLYFPALIDPYSKKIKSETFNITYNQRAATKLIGYSQEELDEARRKKAGDPNKKYVDEIKTKILSDQLTQAIDDILVKVHSTVKQYRESEQELKRQLYKIFDPSEEESFKLLEGFLTRLVKARNDDTQLNLEMRSITQYINFIQEVYQGLQNIKENYVYAMNAEYPDDFKKIKTLENIFNLAISYRGLLEGIQGQLTSVDPSNIFKTRVKDAIGYITDIDQLHKRTVVPIMANVLDDQFSPEMKDDILKELQDRKAIKMRQLAANPEGRIAKLLKSEIALLDKEIALIPSKDLITKAIQGQMGDVAWWSSLIANITNPDLILSAATKILKTILKDLRIMSIRSAEAYGKEFQKRIEVIGDKRDNPAEMQKELTYKVAHDVDENGEVLYHLHIVTEVDENVYFEYNQLLSELSEAKFIPQTNEEEKQSKKLLLASIRKKIREFEDEHFEPKYIQEYYDVLKSTDIDLISEDGKTIINPRLEIEEIFDEIREIQSKNRAAALQGTMEQEDLDKMKDLWRKYYNLFSEFNLDGSEKTGVHKQAQEILLARKQKLEKLRNPSGEKKDKKLNYALWNRYREELKEKLKSQYTNYEDEYLTSEEWLAWEAYNTTVTPTQEFYDRREKILSSISDLLKSEKVEDRQEKINGMWNTIFSLVKPYKNNERTFDVNDMPEKVRKKVILLQHKIVAEQKQIKADRKLSAAKRSQVSDLFAQLEKIQRTETTEQYFEDMKAAQIKYLAEKSVEDGKIYSFADLFTDANLDIGFKQTQWYKTSHVFIEETDKNGKVTEKIKPAYFYTRTNPVEESDVELKPASQYSINEEHQHLKNPDYLDVFNRRKVKISSKFHSPKHYKDIFNSDTERNRVNKENLIFLKQRLENAQNGLYKGNIIGWAVPSLEKSSIDRLHEKDVRGILEDVKRGIVRNAQDLSEGYLDTGKDRFTLTDMSGEQAKFIPVSYTQKIELENQSYDVFQAVMLYEMSAEKAKLLEDKESFFNSLYDVIDKNKPQEEGMVSSLARAINKKFNIGSPEGVSSITNRRASELKDLMNRVFYGEQKVDLFTIKGISDSKAIDSLLSFAGKNIMLLNIPNWITNFFSGNIQLILESVGATSFTKKNLADAKMELYSTRMMKDIVEDWGKLSDRSLIGQMIDLFDPIQGEFEDEFGKRQSWSKRRHMDKLLFSGKIFGEWELQMTSFLAILKAIPVKTISSEGVEGSISLFDAFEKGTDGVATLKEEVKRGGFTEANLNDVINKVHSVNKALNGNYNKFDAPSLEKYSIFRAFTFMRKFFIPLLMNRFAGFRQDIEFGTWREGHWVIFWDTIIKDIRKYGLGVAKLYKNGEYTPRQMAAINKTLTEITGILLFGLLIAGLSALDDDLEKQGTDSFALKYILYIMKRTSREMQSVIPLPFMGLQEAATIFKTPFVAWNQIGVAMNLASLGGMHMLDATQLVDFEKELYYQKDSGWWDKGDSKFIANLYKLIGIKWNILDPETLNKNFVLQQSWIN